MENDERTYAVLEPAGTNTCRVAICYFEHKTASDFQAKLPPRARGYRTNRQVVEAVGKGEVNFGVVAIETLSGIERPAMDAIIKNPSVVPVEELRVPIRHALIAVRPYELDEIVVVRSHEQALSQCEDSLATYVPHAATEARTSTTRAMEELKTERMAGIAALGDKEFARANGLYVLRENFQDSLNNATRFLVLMHYDPALGSIGLRTPDDGYRTVVLAHLENKPGALSTLLEVLNKHKRNMTRIELRSTKRDLGEYVFWVEFEGYTREPEVMAILEEMQECTRHFRCLGSFGITHMDPWGPVLYPKGRSFYYPK